MRSGSPRQHLDPLRAEVAGIALRGGQHLARGDRVRHAPVRIQLELRDRAVRERRLPVGFSPTTTRIASARLAVLERLEPEARRVHAHVAPARGRAAASASARDSRAPGRRAPRGARQSRAQPLELAHERRVLGVRRRELRERIGDVARRERAREHVRRVERRFSGAREARMQRARIDGAFREMAREMQERVREQHVELRGRLGGRGLARVERARDRLRVVGGGRRPCCSDCCSGRQQLARERTAQALRPDPGDRAPATRAPRRAPRRSARAPRARARARPAPSLAGFASSACDLLRVRGKSPQTQQQARQLARPPPDVTGSLERLAASSPGARAADDSRRGPRLRFTAPIAAIATRAAGDSRRRGPDRSSPSCAFASRRPAFRPSRSGSRCARTRAAARAARSREPLLTLIDYSRPSTAAAPLGARSRAAPRCASTRSSRTGARAASPARRRSRTCPGRSSRASACSAPPRPTGTPRLLAAAGRARARREPSRLRAQHRDPRRRLRDARVPREARPARAQLGLPRARPPVHRERDRRDPRRQRAVRLLPRRALDRELALSALRRRGSPIVHAALAHSPSPTP